MVQSALSPEFSEQELRAALDKLPPQVQSLFAADLLSGRAGKPGYQMPGDPTNRGFIRRPKGVKFEATEREEIKLYAAQLERMGYREVEIAAKIGIEKDLIRGLLKDTREEYNASILDVRKDMALRELAVLLDVRREAFEGLERAKQGLRNYTHSQTIGGKDGNTFEDTEEEREVLPPAEYMRIILQTNQRICDMFDLDEAVKQIVNVNVNAGTTVVLTPETLLKTILENRRKQDDPVKVRLAEVEADGRPSIVYNGANGEHKNGDMAT